MPVHEVTEVSERHDASPDTLNESWLLTFMDRASKERTAQTESFERALNRQGEDFKTSIGLLRGDFRTFGVIMLAGILALAGVNVAINAGAFSFDATPTSAPLPAAPPAPVPPEITP